MGDCVLIGGIRLCPEVICGGWVGGIRHGVFGIDFLLLEFNDTPRLHILLGVTGSMSYDISVWRFPTYISFPSGFLTIPIVPYISLLEY